MYVYIAHCHLYKSVSNGTVYMVIVSALYGARSQEFHSSRHMCCDDVTIKVIWFDLIWHVVDAVMVVNVNYRKIGSPLTKVVGQSQIQEKLHFKSVYIRKDRYILQLTWEN